MSLLEVRFLLVQTRTLPDALRIQPQASRLGAGYRRRRVPRAARVPSLVPPGNASSVGLYPDAVNDQACTLVQGRRIQTSARTYIAQVGVAGPFLHCAGANSHWVTVFSPPAALGTPAPSLCKTKQLAHAFDLGRVIVPLPPRYRRQQFPNSIESTPQRCFCGCCCRRCRGKICGVVNVDASPDAIRCSWRPNCLVDYYQDQNWPSHANENVALRAHLPYQSPTGGHEDSAG